MRVTVVGSEGYIGRPLCARLRQEGHKVTGLDCRAYGEWNEREFVTSVLHKEQRDLFLDGSDAVVWLAAWAHDPRGRIKDNDLWGNNYCAPLNVAQEIQINRPGKIRFVVPSSMSIYSPGVYGETKKALEKDLFDLWRFHEFVNVIRLGTISGFYESESFRAHLLLNRMVLDALRLKEVTINGSSVVRPICSLWLAVEQLRMAVTSPKVGQVQSVYTQSRTLQDYFEDLKSIPSFKDTKAIFAAPVDQRDYGPLLKGRPLDLLIDLKYHLGPQADEIWQQSEQRLQQYYENLQE